MININCIYNDGAYCKNKNIKRSMFGLGARLCMEYPPNVKECKYKKSYPQPQVVTSLNRRIGNERSS